MPLPLDLPSILGSGGLPDRTWLSFATVDDQDPVTFDAELGPLVSVTTHPEGRPLVCRVGMRIAGKGEGEYEPFVAGDELLVAIVEGSPRAGGVVLCRLCNSIDRFPADVMGQDPTTNAFGFTRRIAPHIEESAGPIFTRQASTGAFWGVAADGTITLRSGNASALQLSDDLLGMQSGDARFLVQLDVKGGRFSVQAGDALLTLSSSGASPEKSAIVVPGTLAVTTAATPAAEHVVTTEALFNILQTWQDAFFQVWTIAWAAIPTPAPGAPMGAPLVSALAVVFRPETLALVPGVAAAATQSSLIAAAIVATFGSATQKPAASPVFGQTRPGIGAAAFFAG